MKFSKKNYDMLQKPSYYKRYNPARSRFVKPAIEEFFKKEFPKHFGPVMRNNIALELIEIFEKLNIEKSLIKPGQMLWNALHKNTRADSPNRKLIPVILTIVSENDVEQLAKGTSIVNVKKNVIARIIKEAYKQNGILSMRDVALITSHSDSYISILRKSYEKQNNEILPHTGNLHDMGSCITHKYQIVYKVIVEKKDPTLVARETNHSQKAVDNYLQSYHRVHTLYKDGKDINFIHTVTNISKLVIKQYLEIIEHYVKEL